ncbi:MAG: hypothetical protein K5852_06995 [Eubacterium sp.]|nr:hypothetical protein [Eubacterium sp.]
MFIEITGYAIIDRRYIVVESIDVSEMQLMRLERRDDGCEREITFMFDTKDPKASAYIYRWLRKHKSKDASTLGESLRSVVGRVCELSGYYRVWDE